MRSLANAKGRGVNGGGGGARARAAAVAAAMSSPSAAAGGAGGDAHSTTSPPPSPTTPQAAPFLPSSAFDVLMPTFGSATLISQPSIPTAGKGETRALRTPLEIAKLTVGLYKLNAVDP